MQAAQLEFRKRALIEQRHALTCRLMLARHGRKPVRSPETVFVMGRLARGGKPVWPLPAEFFSKHRTGGAQIFVQWRSAQRPSAGVLLARPGDGVVLAVQ